jgi:glutamate synthase (NADPH/NADH) small chain
VAEFDSGELDARDKHVVVVGGGDTAMDCVRTAVRQGARSVSCLYRRDRDNMPGSFREVAHGEAEGVAFVWLSAPEAFLGEARVAQVRARKMRLGMPDQSGRQSPEPIEDAAFTLPCDLAVKALGFDPEDVPALFAAPELAVTRWGTIRIDYDSKMTNLPGVFAAGDIVRGASLVVWAIRDGLDAARQMHAYVQGGTASEDMPLAEAS